MASSQDCLDLPLDALIAQQPRHNHPLSRPNMSSSSPLMELLRRGKKIEAKNPQPPSEKMSSSPIMELLKHEKQTEEKNYQAPSEHGKQSEAKASQLSDSILREVFELHDEISVRKRMQKAAARDAGTVEKTTPSLEFRTCQKMTSSLLSSLYEFIVESLQKSTMVEEAWERLRESIFYEGQPVASLDSTALNDNGSKETIAADFGGSAIGRVSPLDSGFWWIILLRAYTEFTGDHTLREPSEVKKEMRLILKLCLSDDFDTSPTLLCADGCSMIDSRMGICGYPVEIQELFCFALRCAMQLLKPEDTDKDSCDSSGSKEIIAADFGGGTSVPDMAHAGKDLRLSGNKRKGEDDEPDRANKRPIARLGRPRPPIEVYRLDHGARITEVAPTLYSVENRDHVHLVGSIGSVGHMWGISRIESALSQCLISADIDPARHIEHLYYSRRTDCWGEVQSLPTPSEAADWRQHDADWKQFKSSVMGVLVRKGDLQV